MKVDINPRRKDSQNTEENTIYVAIDFATVRRIDEKYVVCLQLLELACINFLQPRRNNLNFVLVCFFDQ